MGITRSPPTQGATTKAVTQGATTKMAHPTSEGTRPTNAAPQFDVNCKSRNDKKKHL